MQRIKEKGLIKEVLNKENDGKYFVVKFRDRNVTKYKSHFKRNRVTNFNDCRNQFEAASPKERVEHVIQIRIARILVTAMVLF